MDAYDLTGSWEGHYVQHDRPSPIRAELIQQGDRLTGTMRDIQPETDLSVEQVAAEAGLPPGADEQIVARLRSLFPEAPAARVRYVAQQPPESSLEGSVHGSAVEFVKTYRGAHFSGYAVGDTLVGHQIEGHAVHYEGGISPDGCEIEGKWWIGPPRGYGPRHGEGAFRLRREG